VGPRDVLDAVVKRKTKIGELREVATLGIKKPYCGMGAIHQWAKYYTW
jgi:hypothetical protein